MPVVVAVGLAVSGDVDELRPRALVCEKALTSRSAKCLAVVSRPSKATAREMGPS